MSLSDVVPPYLYPYLHLHPSARKASSTLRSQTRQRSGKTSPSRFAPAGVDESKAYRGTAIKGCVAARGLHFVPSTPETLIAVGCHHEAVMQKLQAAYNKDVGSYGNTLYRHHVDLPKRWVWVVEGTWRSRVATTRPNCTYDPIITWPTKLKGLISGV